MYEGEFYEIKKHGLGKLADMLDNSCYKGESKEGLKDGKVIFISSHGTKMYDGSLKLDKYYDFDIFEF